MNREEISEYLKRSRARRRWWAQWDTFSDDDEAEKQGGEENEEDNVNKVQTKRRTYDRENNRESCWWKFLQRDNLDDLTSRDGKTSETDLQCHINY